MTEYYYNADWMTNSLTHSIGWLTGLADSLVTYYDSKLDRHHDKQTGLVLAVLVRAGTRNCSTTGQCVCQCPTTKFWNWLLLWWKVEGGSADHTSTEMQKLNWTTAIHKGFGQFLWCHAIIHKQSFNNQMTCFKLDLCLKVWNSATMAVHPLSHCQWTVHCTQCCTAVTCVDDDACDGWWHQFCSAMHSSICHCCASTHSSGIQVWAALNSCFLKTGDKKCKIWCGSCASKAKHFLNLWCLQCSTCVEQKAGHTMWWGCKHQTPLRGFSRTQRPEEFSCGKTKWLFVNSRPLSITLLTPTIISFSIDQVTKTSFVLLLECESAPPEWQCVSLRSFAGQGLQRASLRGSLVVNWGVSDSIPWPLNFDKPLCGWLCIVCTQSKWLCKSHNEAKFWNLESGEFKGCNFCNHLPTSTSAPWASQHMGGPTSRANWPIY